MASPKHADAWRHTYGASLQLAHQFSPADWDRRTECPAWSVRDIVSHLVGAEQWVLGDRPEYDLPDLDHVRTDFDRWTEVHVLQRRDVPPATLLAEFQEVYDRRSAQLAAQDGADEVPTPWGFDAPVDHAVATRIYDCWTHEQDLRRAVGRPGNLDSPAARVVRSQLLHALPRLVAREARAEPGQVVRLEVTGQLSFDTDIAVDPDGLGVARASTGHASVVLNTSWETFARLCSGRLPANRAPVTYLGNVELGLRVAQSLIVTP
ncbi:maleylpyruvate isomerase family mycothiol-dependent enzyme [Longispora sp. NPDC051575]|uniref:maleylpyruvate isomerase family mycothiol-dependent enzyme n=1 Tax=Longispora sp. NPDC051575 TaxID=3154943 RepID=UPI003436A2D4